MFEGIPSVQEVTCTGSALPADAKLVSITLFPLRERGHQLAYVMLLLQPSCSTSDVFSSCLVDERDSRRTALKTLVTDLRPGEAREYGCNVTLMKAGAKTESRLWTVRVERPSE